MVPRRPDACYGGGIHRFLVITFHFQLLLKSFSTFASEESLLLPFIVSFHQGLYTNSRGRDCTENLWTILLFVSLVVCPMQQKTITIEKYFTKFFVNLKKLLKLKPRYAGNPRKMPETVSSGEDSFASRWPLPTDPKWYWLRWWPRWYRLRWWPRWYWLGWRQFWWSQNLNFFPMHLLCWKNMHRLTERFRPHGIMGD